MRKTQGSAPKEVRTQPERVETVTEPDESEAIASALLEKLPKPTQRAFRLLRESVGQEGDDLDDRTVRSLVITALQAARLEGREVPVDQRWTRLFQSRRRRKRGSEAESAQQILAAWQEVTGHGFSMKLVPQTKPYGVKALIHEREIDVTAVLNVEIIEAIAQQLLESRAAVAAAGNSFQWQAIARNHPGR